MIFKEWIAFKRYMLMRKEAFRKQYKLGGKWHFTSYSADLHLINNLKYLDRQSQNLIKRMNNPNYTLRDKIMSTFVFRVTGDYTYSRFFANRHYIFDLSSVEALADSLDEPWDIIELNYEIGIKNGRDLKIAVESLLELMDKGYSFLNKKPSVIYRELKEFGILGVNGFLLSEFIYDLSYIDELNIKLDLIPVLDYRGKEVYLLITGYSDFVESEYEAFVERVLKSYTDVRARHWKEVYISPVDVSHMLIGYYNFRHKKLKRKRKVREYNIEDIVLPRSIYDYIKSNRIYSEAHRRARRLLS